ncbi:hypothetical protein ACFELO_01525 [Oceanicaulis sp. LC35]|uniref:hypothetical protein n=1 Tax=Oceanicaulis sp. LC35 TaxID=3349635 RepID=UPI003F856AC6
MIRTLLTCTVLAAAATPISFAQDSRAEALARCAQITNDQARLSCFDIVMGGGSATNAAQTGSAASQSDTAVAVGEGDDFGRPDTTAGSALRFPSIPTPQFPSFGQQDGEALAGENGSGQVAPDTEIIERNSSGDPSRVMMQIDRISTHGYNTKRFHMTNGQVWEVTDGMRFSIPRNTQNLSAEIRTASFGGYFLRIEGEGRAIRVQRID